MSTNTPGIAIVDAGPGGLLCAAMLRRRGIPATVLERDPGAHHRDQGGSLDLHEHTGQAALRAAGLYDTFLRLSRPEGREMREYDHTGRLVSQEYAPEGPDRPEIDRIDLRDMLLNDLGQENVRWNTPVQKVGLTPESPTARLTLGDGTSEEFEGGGHLLQARP